MDENVNNMAKQRVIDTIEDGKREGGREESRSFATETNFRARSNVRWSKVTKSFKMYLGDTQTYSVQKGNTLSLVVLAGELAKLVSQFISHLL